MKLWLMVVKLFFSGDDGLMIVFSSADNDVMLLMMIKMVVPLSLLIFHRPFLCYYDDDNVTVLAFSLFHLRNF